MEYMEYKVDVDPKNYILEYAKSVGITDLGGLSESLDKVEEHDNIIFKMEKEYPEMMKEFKKIQREQYKTFAYKQNDYGPSNISMGTDLKTKEDLKLSLTALIVRINDKINRLINLVIKKDEKPVNESIEDAFKDLSVYGIISQIVMNGKWGK